MEKNYFKRSKMYIMYTLILGILFLNPFITKAQEQYFGPQGELIGTSDSRMVITINETEDRVELKVMAIGPILAHGFGFDLVYQPNALVLTDATYARDIPLSLNVNDLQNVISALPGLGREVMSHRLIEAGGAAGMHALHTTVYTLRSFTVPEGEMRYLYSIFFRKQVSGEPLNTTDIGFYNNQGIPRSFSRWYYYGVSVNHGKGGASDAYYLRPDLFLIRSHSYVNTSETAIVEGTTAVISGTFAHGDFTPTDNIIVGGLNSAEFTGLLDYDIINKYGFIYSDTDAVVVQNNISDKLNIDGIDYDFPNNSEISAGIFTRGEKTFYITLQNNTSSDQYVNFSQTLTGLSESTTYYAWSFINYAFQTSDTYIAVGNKVSFTTESEVIEEYRGAQGELIGTSKSHMIITINETEDKVELKAMIMGPVMANGYGFDLVYQPNSLILTDETYTREIPLGSNPSDLGNVISFDPDFKIRNPRFIKNSMYHREIPSGSAAGMHTLMTETAASTVNVSINLVEGEILPIYSVYFKKRNPDIPLNSSDIGFYANPTIPRTSSAWGYNGVHISHGRMGASDAHYLKPDLFTYRSPSYVNTNNVASISETSATISGTFTRGNIESTNEMVITGLNSAAYTGLLDCDIIKNYGFIYSTEDAVIMQDKISDKLNIDGIDYEFPNEFEIMTGTFIRGEKTFYIILQNNVLSDQSVDFSQTITGLVENTEYYAWSLIDYTFQTSDNFVKIGNKISFTTGTNGGLLRNIKVDDTENLKKQELSVYPNPTSGIFTISYLENENSEIQNICVYDMLGSQLYETTSTTLNIGHLPEGIYFVKVGDKVVKINKK